MARIIDEDYILNNGVRIPKLAFGTWQIPDDKAADCVAKAIAIGYRYIDTAVDYGNERGVGEGIRRSGVDRSKLFITTKILAEQKTYEGAAASIDESLARLGTDYVDLMLIHAPKPWAEIEAGSDRKYFEENRAVWKAMEEAYAAGKVRAIGVSNFSVEDIKNILGELPGSSAPGSGDCPSFSGCGADRSPRGCKIRPAVNQIKVHVGHTPFDVLDYCRAEGILVQAYCPNGHGSLLMKVGSSDSASGSAFGAAPGSETAAPLTGEALARTVLGEMAARYGVSVPQLCIRYDLQLGTLPLPKTMNEAHMRQNAEVDFVISDDDMERLKAL